MDTHSPRPFWTIPIDSVPTSHPVYKSRNNIVQIDLIHACHSLPSFPSIYRALNKGGIISSQTHSHADLKPLIGKTSIQPLPLFFCPHSCSTEGVVTHLTRRHGNFGCQDKSRVHLVGERGHPSLGLRRKDSGRGRCIIGICHQKRIGRGRGRQRDLGFSLFQEVG